MRVCVRLIYLNVYMFEDCRDRTKQRTKQSTENKIKLMT